VTRCFEGPRPTFEETLLELSAEPPVDPALFEPLVGGTESVLCQGVSKPPTRVHTPMPAPPRNVNLKYPVILQLIIETDGKTHDLRVVQSVDEAFDNAAMEAVRRWRFKPATCGGEPIATQISVEINFRMF
jgi:periplasmic protein TonB